MGNRTEKIERGTKAYRSANLALFIAGFVTFSTLYTVQPLLPLLAGEFGVSPATSSLALSVATFALAWMLPVSGSFSDAHGRRALMGTAMTLTSLLALASAFSTTLPALLAARLLQGAALAGVPAVAMAYLNDEMSPRAIGSAMGLYIAGNACGGMTGRILTSLLADVLPWRGAVAVIGLLALTLSLLFWLLLPPSRHFQRRPFRLGPLSASLVGHLREPGLFCLFALAFLFMGGFVTLYNYATFHLVAPPYSLAQSQVACIFLAYAFGACGSSVMGGLVERFGRPRLLCTALAIMTGGALLTLLAPLAAIVAGIVVFTIGFFGAHAVASAWVGARAETARAQASSLYLLAYYLGSSISGTGGGFIWSAWGWPGVVVLILALLTIAGLVLLYLTGLAEKRDQPAAAPEMTAAFGPAAE
ncbi:MAG: MFS transporter [Deltaproteobacteria bacterium]|nr:MAG: MFS transporter [Deltaproteobacteria bacterium]